MNDIRNIAIIAHVDHGKTTLVDAMLRQSNTHLGKNLVGTDLIMDSNDLERERGITIFSKNASVIWKNTKINIIDTPGHADFGGEVERVLKMADGVLLLVDAKEGPMPQTRFVLKKALEMGHKIIVVINKIDKEDARIEYVINKTLDLFLELGADDESALFPTIYSSSKHGKAGTQPDLSKMEDISAVFDAILEHIPKPISNPDEPLQMLVTTLSSDNHKGRIATGRIYSGRLNKTSEVIHINREGVQKKYRLTSLMSFEGLGKADTNEALAGDIVAISGIPDITIGETIADISNPKALELLDIEEPTVRMVFSVNSSPFGGEGEFKTSRQIRDRLFKATETDVALKVEDDASGGFAVSGRGELHLAILIERLRREGFEFQVSRPQVISKVVNGQTLVPFERLYIQVPEAFQGIVMQKLGERRAIMQDMTQDEMSVFLEFIIPTRDLFGYRSEFITDTKGMGILNTSFESFRPDDGIIRKRERGSMVATEAGFAKQFSLVNLQDRGEIFILPATSVYKGMVVGQSARPGDMHVNVCKEKQQTNHRSSGEGVTDHFNVPRIMSLEDALEYIDDTELVEVTPKNIRIRKLDLNAKV